MEAAIDSFDGEHAFLSNFFTATVIYEGVKYATVEHAYQAAKCAVPEERAKFTECILPGKAKQLGKTVLLREDWDEVKQSVMQGLLRQKFAHPSLRKRLIATNPRMLIEGNTWGDTYWGVCKGKGHNYLGKLLMLVRADALLQSMGN